MFTKYLQALVTTNAKTCISSIEEARKQVYGSIEFHQSEALVYAQRDIKSYVRSYACELHGFPKESIDEFVVKSTGTNESIDSIRVDFDEYNANVRANQTEQALIDLIEADADKCFVLYCIPHRDGGWGYLKFAETETGISFSMTIITRI